MKERDVRLKGQLKVYMYWPVIMTVLLIAMNLWMYKVDRKAGVVMSVFVIIYAVMVGGLYFYKRSLILADMIQFSTQYRGIQNTLLQELTVPYAILLEDGKILWRNKLFAEIFADQKREKYMYKLIPELGQRVIPHGDVDHVELEVHYQDRDYQAVLRKVSVEGFSDTEEVVQMPEGREYFVTLCLNDVTELNSYIRENEDQRMIAGLIYIDNYDEVMESVEEVRQSLLVALIDRKINKYIGDEDGIVKKLEKDKYFIVIRKESYRKFEADKFSLLEEVKQVNIGNARSASLSIGLGLNTTTYAQSYNYARMAIDLALARGGDQAVAKDSQSITYFGGKKEQTSKNTRVKARVKAEALREFITGKDIDFKNNGIKVTRKGGNEMIVYFGEEVEHALKQYIYTTRKATVPLAGHENALFLSTQKKRMGVQAVENMVKKYAHEVTPNKKITPHKLRSTYGTALYKETGDIYLVADVLGHKDVNTTKKHYAAIDENRRRQAAGAVKLREP